MQIKFIDGTDGKSTGPQGTTLQVLAECGGVKRMVQGIVGETSEEREESRNAIAQNVFADIIEAGEAPPAKVEPVYDEAWAKEIVSTKKDIEPA